MTLSPVHASPVGGGVVTSPAELDRHPLTLLNLAGERRSPRFRFGVPVSATLGRREVSLIDISARGARIRHVTPVRPGEQMRLRFEYQGRTFDLESRILDSRLITLGAKDPVYESRLRLTPTSREQRESIDAAIGMLSSRDEGRRTGRPISAPSAESPAASDEPSTFCRLVANQWRIEKGRTGDIQFDGFVVPSYTGEREIHLLCDAYEKLDGEGRRLLRRFAAAG
jgi:hypothetical protein